MSRASTNVPDGDSFVSDSFSERTSKNLSAAKGVAALTVMLGHFTSIPNFWVVVTVQWHSLLLQQKSIFSN